MPEKNQFKDANPLKKKEKHQKVVKPWLQQEQFVLRRFYNFRLASQNTPGCHDLTQTFFCWESKAMRQTPHDNHANCSL